MFRYLFILYCFCVAHLFAQDSKFFDKLFNIDEFSLIKKEKFHMPKEYTFRAGSKAYQFDYNQDRYDELIVFEKRDGLDYLLFFDENKKLVSTVPLHRFGEKSTIVSLKLKTISSKYNLLVVNHLEGVVDARDKTNYSRLYFVIIERKKKLSVTHSMGPQFSIDKIFHKDLKIKRDYKILFNDLDNDGIKEVIIRFSDRIKRVYKFNKKKKIMVEL